MCSKSQIKHLKELLDSYEKLGFEYVQFETNTVSGKIEAKLSKPKEIKVKERYFKRLIKDVRDIAFCENSDIDDAIEKIVYNINVLLEENQQ